MANTLSAKFRSVFLLIFTLFVAVACEPIPRDFSVSDRESYMRELQTVFDREYAFKKYKSKTERFNYEKLKERYIADAKKDISDEEFLRLMKQFVAEFADAHVSISFNTSDLSGRIFHSFLGFSGHREGETLKVTQISELIGGPWGEFSESFPVQEGDAVTHVYDEKSKKWLSLRDYINKDLVDEIDLGNSESNFTALANALFNRNSMSTGLPSGVLKDGKPQLKNIKLRLDRAGEAVDVELPWITKDLVDLRKDIENLAEATHEMKKTGRVKNLVLNRGGKKLYVNYVDSLGRLATFRPFQKQIEDRASATPSLLGSFEFQPRVTSFQVTQTPKADSLEDLLRELIPPTPKQVLQVERWIPEDAHFVEDTVTFPAYSVEKEGKKFGYIRVGSFSPDTIKTEDELLEEIKSALQAFHRRGVKNITIDSMGNPGGSISLVLKMSQLFSDKKINSMGLQYGLMDRWMDNMQRMSETHPSLYDRQIYKGIYEEMKKAKASGKEVTSTIPLEKLFPGQLKVDEDMKEIVGDFKFAHLIDEMSASAGDMFPAMTRENGLATLIGRRTMGAGGNVVAYDKSFFRISQTQSRLISPNGTYLENRGVYPHIERDPTLSRGGKYRDMITEAEKYLTNPASFAAEMKTTLAKQKEAEAKLGIIDPNTGRLLKNESCASLLANMLQLR